MIISQIKKLTCLKHLNLVEVRYRDRNNQEKSWIYASRPSDACPDAVVVVPFHTQAEKLVLIREYRVPLQDFQYGFPAGLVDPGETVAKAGERELLEETGLLVTRVIQQSPPIYSSSGLTDESVSLLYVECRGEPTTQMNAASEEIEVLMVSRDQARDLIQRDQGKFDVKSWIVLERFAETGRIVRPSEDS